MVQFELRLVPPLQRVEEVIQALRCFIGPTKAEPGYLSCAIYLNAEQSNSILYQERWVSWEALTSHVRMSRYASLIELMETAIEPPLLQFHDVSETRGIEFLQKIRGVPDPVKKSTDI